MAASRNKSRFESEVRLGLLVIIFLLFFLNFLSNFIIFRARATKRDETTGQFRAIAATVARQISRGDTVGISDATRDELIQTHRLNSIDVVPTGPGDESIESRRQWFASITSRLPADEVHAFAEKLLGADFDRLARGEGNEYFFVSPFHRGTERGLIILARDVPDLAYIEDSQTRVVYISAGSLLAIFAVYLLLSRRIFVPFRKIKERAMIAGRQVDADTDDAEAVVEEYRSVIEELQQKEQELLALNRAIQRKADSLEQFNEYLLQSMRSGLVTIDVDGVIVTFNDVACTLFSCDREDCIGRSYVEIFSPDTGLGRAIRELVSERTACEYAETDYPTPSGRTLAIGLSTSPIYDSDQQPIGGAILLHDLSEINRLRGELETRNRLAALGEMAGGLAHQLRNSMGAIGGYLTLLKKRLDRKGVEDNAVTELADEARQAEHLIRRFLQFARPLRLAPEAVTLRELLDDITSTFAVREDLPGIRVIATEVADTSVNVDTLLLKQALTNLTENAANAYGGGEGVVELMATVDDDAAYITITDRGCGIPADDLDKIFTPFFSSRPAGNGLGLPLAQKILDLHGGRLSVTSRVGDGTTFTLTLPVNVPAGRPVAL